MSSNDKIESSMNERSWQCAINSGKLNKGNLNVNLEFLKETGLIKPEMTALELGCGSGNLASILQKQGISIIASDIAQTAIDLARKQHPDIEFRTHSADTLPYDDNNFDIVMSFDVLEHLPDVDLHLKQVYRVLKPDGYYIFQTPNKLSNAVYETLKCRSMEWKKYHPSLHLYGQLKQRLRKNRFSPTFFKMNTMNEWAVKKIKKVGLPGWLFGWINFRYLPYRLQTNFYVVAQKQDSV